MTKRWRWTKPHKTICGCGVIGNMLSSNLRVLGSSPNTHALPL